MMLVFAVDIIPRGWGDSDLFLLHRLGHSICNASPKMAGLDRLPPNLKT